MDFNSYKKVISNCNHIVKVGMVSAYALFLGANTAEKQLSLESNGMVIKGVLLLPIKILNGKLH